MTNDPVWYSATQIDSFDRCPRKWAFRYLDGVKREQDDDPSRQLGLKVHGVLAAWLERAAALDITTKEGQIAMRGLAMLPPPKTEGMAVERWFGFRAGGFQFQGYKDVQLLGGPIPIVIDHKTTKNFNYAKTPEELTKDTQAGLYAADAMIKTGAESTALRWLYYSTTKNVPAKAVDVVLTRDQVEPILARSVQAARRMDVLRGAGVAAKEVPCNPNACRDFGGCDFLDICDQDQGEQMSLDLDNYINSLKSGKPAINPPTTSSPPPARRTVLPPAPSKPAESVLSSSDVVSAPVTPVTTPVSTPVTLPSPVNEAAKSRAKKVTVEVVDTRSLAFADLMVDLGQALVSFGGKLREAQ